MPIELPNHPLPPETLCSLASPSSLASDQLSSLGVRLREFPDPLADWEELEPGMERRRIGFMDLVGGSCSDQRVGTSSNSNWVAG